MLNQLPPAARWGLLAALLLLGVVGGYLNLRSSDVRLPDTGVIVEGLVTLDGVPLPYAVVTLFPAEEPPKEGAIFSKGNLERDGTLRIASAPIGKVKIAVNTAEVRGQLMGEFMAASQKVARDGKPVEAPKVIDVDGKYFSPDSSGIEETLVRGVNKIKIELKSKA